MSQGLEIERKFLLKRMPKTIRADSSTDPFDFIFQLYCQADKKKAKDLGLRSEGQYRIRKVVPMFKNESFKRRIILNQKTKISAGVYDEFETDSNNDVYISALDESDKYLIKKRYSIKENGLVWEVDEIQYPKRMVLVEVELASMDQKIKMPDWISEVLDREVTEEPGFTNFEIASYEPPRKKRTKK